MTDEWIWDDALILNDHLVYRRVPKAVFEGSEVIDAKTDLRVVSPAALRYDYDGGGEAQQEGMSVHLDRVLQLRKRDPETIYGDEDRTLVFPAGAPRKEQGGVHPEPDPVDADEDRSAAHALIRASVRLIAEGKKPKHPEWNRIRSAISEAAWWLHVVGTERAS